MEEQQSREIGLAREIGEQRRGVTVGVVKVPLSVVVRWEEMARELEGLPSKDESLEAVPTTVHDGITPQASLSH